MGTLLYWISSLVSTIPILALDDIVVNGKDENVDDTVEAMLTMPSAVMKIRWMSCVVYVSSKQYRVVDERKCSHAMPKQECRMNNVCRLLLMYIYSLYVLRTFPSAMLHHL